MKGKKAKKSVASVKRRSGRTSVEETAPFAAKRIKVEKNPQPQATATAVVIPAARLVTPPAGASAAINDGQPDLEHFNYYESFRNGRFEEFRNLDDRTRARIVRQAFQQSPLGVLLCLNSPRCSNSYKSYLGAKYHLERCGDQNELPATNPADQDKQNAYYQYKNKFDEWKALSAEQRTDIMQQALLVGPMPCLRASTCKSTFSSLSSLKHHLETCEKRGGVKPSPGTGVALTPNEKRRLGEVFDSYKGRLVEWRQMDPKERTRIVRATMIVRGTLNCLDDNCSTQSTHAYGLGYHLDRCGLTDQEKPWKCYRCGHTSVVAKSRDHLDECLQPPPTVKREGEAVSTAAVDTFTPPAIPGVRRSAAKALKKLHMNDDVQRAIQVSEEEDEVDASDGDDEYTPSMAEAAAMVSDAAEREVEDRRRNRGRRVVSGCVPAGSCRTTVIAGKKRYKFKLNEQRMHEMKVMDKKNYKKDMREAYDRFMKSHAAIVSAVINDWKCPADDWTSTKESHREAYRLVCDKLSVSIKTKSSVGGDSGKRVDAFSGVDVDEDLSAAYCGGPIASVAWCPNALSDNCQLVAVSAFTDDEQLLSNLSESTVGLVQLWKVGSKNKSGSRIATIAVLLETEFGQVLDCCWCPVGFIGAQEENKPLGALAVATVSGQVAIFCIPNRFDASSNGPAFLRPTPVAVLAAPCDNDQQRPPIQSLAWCPFDGGNLLVGVLADGRVTVWDLRSVIDGQPTKVLFDEAWISPPVDVAWLTANQIALSFREKMVRVFELDSLACILEEMGSRTAGSRLVSCPSVFPGILTFQSEQVNTNGFLTNLLNYITFDQNQEGFFVVPLLNRHHQPIWDVTVSPQTGLVASVGGDGLVVVSLSGRLAPINSKRDLASSVNKVALSVETERLHPRPSAVDDNAIEMYCTHDACVSELCLRVKRECDEKEVIPKSPADQALTTFSPDLPLASLTCAAFSLNSSTPSLICVGGQAGLLFFFDADIA